MTRSAYRHHTTDAGETSYFHDRSPPMVALLVAAIFTVAAAGLLVRFWPTLLLRWYLHEVRRIDIPEEPAEAIVTYPFA